MVAGVDVVGGKEGGEQGLSSLPPGPQPRSVPESLEVAPRWYWCRWGWGEEPLPGDVGTDASEVGVAPQLGFVIEEEYDKKAGKAKKKKD